MPPETPTTSPDALDGLEAAPADFAPALPTDAPTGEVAPLEGAQELPEASGAGHGRPRMPDTPERVRRRARYQREKARRAGRPVAPAAEGTPEAPAGPSPEDMAAVGAALALGFQTVAKLVAGRRGKHWELTAGEAGQLGAAWAEAARPWLGRVGPAVPWVTAALVTAGVVAPRLIADGEAPGDNPAPPSSPAPESAPPPPAPPAPRAGDSPVAIQPPRTLPPSGDGTVPIAPPPEPPGAGGGPIRPPKGRK